MHPFSRQRGSGAAAIAEVTDGLRRLGPTADPAELVKDGDMCAATEALRPDAQLLREVFQFGRDFSYVQLTKETGVGLEQLGLDW